MDLGGIDRVDHVPPTGEERSKRRDAGAHVDQPAAHRQVLDDQTSGHRVFPEPGDVIGKEPDGTSPVDSEREQRVAGRGADR